jgi:hypothetical protein
MSTSIVGFPLESRICLALISTIALIFYILKWNKATKIHFFKLLELAKI